MASNKIADLLRRLMNPAGAGPAVALCREARVALAQMHEECMRLHERLEDNHCFIDGRRVEMEPGSIPDGIECRDETIKMQDRIIGALHRGQ